MSLADQTIGFFLQLDTKGWDKAVKTVDTKYGAFVKSVESFNKTLEKSGNGVIDKMAASMSNLATSTTVVTKAMAGLQRAVSQSGKTIKVPIELVIAGAGGKGGRGSSLDSAIQRALTQSTLRLRPYAATGNRGLPPDGTGSQSRLKKSPSTMVGYYGTFVPKTTAAGNTIKKYNAGGTAKYGDQALARLNPTESVVPQDVMKELVKVLKDRQRHGLGTHDMVRAGEDRLRWDPNITSPLVRSANIQMGIHRAATDMEAGFGDQRGVIADGLRGLDEEIRKLTEATKKLTGAEREAAKVALINAKRDRDSASHLILPEGIAGDTIRGMMQSRNPFLKSIGTSIASSPKVLAGAMAVGGAYGVVKGGTQLIDAVGGFDAYHAYRGIRVGASQRMGGNAAQTAGQVMSGTNSLIRRDEIADAFNAVAGSGAFHRQNAGAITQSVAMLSKATGVSSGTIAEDYANRFRSFGESLPDATVAIEKMAAMAQRAGVSLESIVQTSANFRKMSVGDKATGSRLGADAARLVASVGNVDKDYAATVESALMAYQTATPAEKGSATNRLIQLGLGNQLYNLEHGNLDVTRAIAGLNASNVRRSIPGRSLSEARAMEQAYGLSPGQGVNAARAGAITEIDARGFNSQKSIEGQLTNAERLSNAAAGLVDKSVAAMPEFTSGLLHASMAANVASGALLSLATVAGGIAGVRGAASLGSVLLGAGGTAAAGGGLLAGAKRFGKGAAGFGARFVARHAVLTAVGATALGVGAVVTNGFGLLADAHDAYSIIKGDGDDSKPVPAPAITPYNTVDLTSTNSILEAILRAIEGRPNFGAPSGMR